MPAIERPYRRARPNPQEPQHGSHRARGRSVPVRAQGSRVLAEKGLDYQHENVNPFAPPEGWRNIEPLGRIPAFKDGDKMINDSSVICAYLERRFPKPALYPTDDYEYARALWFEEFADGGMIAAWGRSLLPVRAKPLFGGKPEPDPADVAPPRSASPRTARSSGTISSASSATTSTSWATGSRSPTSRSRPGS